jgi:pSer/pThr/pTyr-binding forkhead associated (FHA) protein
MCLTPYPTRFKISEFNKEYELIDLNLPEKSDYMILESLDYIKEKDNLKKIHVIQLTEDKIYIGRNGINDVIDEDLTVSRNHAILKYNKDEGKVVLENISETYGTLVLIKGNIKMKDKNLNLQIGNSFITVNLTSKEKEPI